MGIRGVQLALEPLRSGAWPISSVVEAAQQHSVTLVSGMMQTIGEDYRSIMSIRATGGVRPDHLWDQNLAIAQQDAAHAEALGLPLVSFHAGFVPEDPSDPLHAVMVDRIAQVAQAFAARGVRVALETGQESAPALRELLDQPVLTALGVGVNFDPANMILYGSGDPIRALRLLRDRVVQVHLKDAVASGVPSEEWGEEVPVGTGDVDWAAFFAAIEAGPTVDMIFEREAGEQRIADIEQGKRFVARFGYQP